MLRLTLAQMRLSLGLLTAAGLAIVISTAFVAASLIAGAVITRTSYDAVSASYAHADVVVSAPDGADGVDGGLTPADLAALRQVRGVAAVDGQVPLGTELVAGPKRVYPTVTAVASDPRLEVQTLVSGALPAGPHEVALPGPLADRLDVRVGDEVTTTRQTWAPEQAATAKPTADPATEPAGTWVASTERLTVVGLLDDPAGAFAQSGGAIVVPAADAARWAAQDASGGSGNPGAPATYPRAIVALAQGADAADVAAATSALRKAAPHGTTVRTKDDEAKATTAELTGGSDVFVPIVLGFASIALLVAALVISNTFGVLIAQRTRTLALLRCVGAGKRQLLRSVLIEAGLLGVASSALGLAVGVGLAQLALVVAGHLNLDVPLPAVVAITPAVVLAPLAVGTLVTLIAALAPARAATRVAPLAALRPAEVPAVTSRRNRPRLVLAALLTVGGVALLALAVAQNGSMGEIAALGVGVAGGAMSFVGVLVGAVFWVPAVVGRLGGLLAPAGTAAKLATANTVRNPRRTAATSAALLIGVTLVTMMSTGAATARATLGGALDSKYPVDVMIADESPASTGDGAAPDLLTPALVRTVSGVPGIADVITLRTIDVRLTAGSTTVPSSANIIRRDDATSVVRSTSMVRGFGDTTAIVSSVTAKALGISTGDAVTVTGTTHDAAGAEAPAGAPIEVTATVTDLPAGVLRTPRALARMAVEQPTNQIWVRLTDVNEAGTVVPAISDALSDTAVQISGAGVERAQFQRTIDTLLAVVVGLLAVAVVIALIGVANTLSLSVIERRRESATLRVIGLSRRQLRTMLAIEGMLIAGVGGVLGAALGTLYGWAGSATVLSSLGEVHLQVPWGDLGLVVLVAIVAGLLASVLPGRAAARTSPVAALAVD